MQKVKWLEIGAPDNDPEYLIVLADFDTRQLILDPYAEHPEVVAQARDAAWAERIVQAINA